MMIWDFYLYFSIVAIAFWLVSGTLALYGKRTLAIATLIAGCVTFALFIGLLWADLQRPPLRTKGEIRLWYAFCLALSGLLVYGRWRFRWVILFTGLLATLFTVINLLHPENQSITLMPALQSPWFIPHVIVYILSYAMLGISTITAFVLLYAHYQPQSEVHKAEQLLDDTMYIGFGLLMLGLITGALWAKTAWGNYWDWDPKETWAFITATAYLIALHLRLTKKYAKIAIWLMPMAFILLMVAWIGVDYLPAAKGSIHVYYS